MSVDRPASSEPGEGEKASFMPGETFIWKVNNTAMDFAELVMEPRVKTPQHIHHAHDETYYVLGGSFRFWMAGREVAGSPGSFVFIPRGTPHTWVNDGTTPGRVILLLTPGGMRGYFDELRPLLPELMPGMDDPLRIDPGVMAKAQEIMHRYQYELVGPPLA
jgi:quercetin dioxygenase-like cupin family protein